ncbi:hypothetical protein K438DRAFT_1777062 [Mycena galopus ATCC 62051]|nr:hypothetical protein K438DRAFT_1777062 [Mycena galopus ATCC 62051]
MALKVSGGSRCQMVLQSISRSRKGSARNNKSSHASKSVSSSTRSSQLRKVMYLARATGSTLQRSPAAPPSSTPLGNLEITPVTSPEEKAPVPLEFLSRLPKPHVKLPRLETPCASPILVWLSGLKPLTSRLKASSGVKPLQAIWDFSDTKTGVLMRFENHLVRNLTGSAPFFVQTPRTAAPQHGCLTASPLVQALDPQLKNAFNVEAPMLKELKRKFCAIAQNHLDLYETLGNQRLGTFDKIKGDFLATFSEFKDEALGASRLRLAELYIRRERPKKRTMCSPSRPANPPAPEPHAPPSYTASSSSSKPQPAPQLPAGHDVPYIKAFLESFTPSLLYILPTLIHAGIFDKEKLDAVAKWPRESLRRYLSTLPDTVLVSDLDSVRTGEGEGKGRLRKVVVDALVLRLTFDESEY